MLSANLDSEFILLKQNYQIARNVSPKIVKLAETTHSQNVEYAIKDFLQIDLASAAADDFNSV